MCKSLISEVLQGGDHVIHLFLQGLAWGWGPSEKVLSEHCGLNEGQRDGGGISTQLFPSDSPSTTMKYLCYDNFMMEFHGKKQCPLMGIKISSDDFR